MRPRGLLHPVRTPDSDTEDWLFIPAQPKFHACSVGPLPIPPVHSLPSQPKYQGPVLTVGGLPVPKPQPQPKSLTQLSTIPTAVDECFGPFVSTGVATTSFTPAATVSPLQIPPVPHVKHPGKSMVSQNSQMLRLRCPSQSRWRNGHRFCRSLDRLHQCLSPWLSRNTHRTTRLGCRTSLHRLLCCGILLRGRVFMPLF